MQKKKNTNIYPSQCFKFPQNLDLLQSIYFLFFPFPTLLIVQIKGRQYMFQVCKFLK